MRTVVDAIVDAARGRGTLTVLGTGATGAATAPWRAVHERARRMATALGNHGVRRGSRVGLLGDTSMDLIVALQAMWLSGAAVTVLPRAARNGRRVVADAGIELVVVDEERVAGPALPTGTAVLPLGKLAAEATRCAAATPLRPDPGDLAILQYTSGSTREPRGVPVTHGHLAANLDAMGAATAHDPTHSSRLLSWLPLYHDLGLIAFLAFPMSCGCSLVLQSPSAFAMRPASWLEALSRHRSTMTAAPNFAYRLAAGLLTGDLDLRAVRFMYSGGEPIDAAVMSRFTTAAARYGLDPLAVAPGYGLAEATLAVTISRPGAGMAADAVDPDVLERDGRTAPPVAGGRVRHLVRVGPPVPGTRVRIADRGTGEPLGERRVGHIEVQGPSVVGYHHGSPPASPGTWLRTGDLGYLTGGELVVCGREKDVLFAAGRNVYPQDVEAAAALVAGVRPVGVAAFGVPGPDGDRLVVAVESRSVSAGLRRAVAAAALGESGLSPADVVVVPPGRLPRTSSGKLRRAEARSRYLAGQLGGDPP